jgi:hypothetical protein
MAPPPSNQVSSVNQETCDISCATLPTIAVENLHEYFASGREKATPLGPTQGKLPADLIQALSVLEEPLSKAPQRFGKALESGVEFVPGAGRSAALEFRGQLSQALEKLYFPESDGAPGEFYSDDVQGALMAIHDHFEAVARGLQAEGYQTFRVVPMRDSVGDFWHIHNFYTYILYCGRQVGTEVVACPPGIDRLNLKRRKDFNILQTQKVESFCDKDLVTCVSDTKMGLLVPPEAPHKALDAPLLHSQRQQQANLALGLLAF